jgi:phage major head subunit gpT-like protein
MATINSGNFGELLEPGIRRIYGDVYKQYPEEYTKIFNVESSTRAFEESLSITGFPLVPEMSEGSSVSFENPAQGFKHTITHVNYGLGFIVTRNLFEDDQYRKIRSYPAALARSVRQTVETVGANVLNNGFDSTVATGADGLELLSDAHLLKMGGTMRNELATAADLTETSLEQATIDIADFVDDQGLKLQATEKMLVIPKNLKWQAQKLLGSAQDPFSADNAINPAMNLMPWTVNHYLTDTDAWFIITDVPNGLIFYWRRRPEFTRDNDFDTENAKFKTTMRFSAKWDDFRGIFGSPGA